MDKLEEVIDEVYLEFRLHGHDISKKDIKRIFIFRSKPEAHVHINPIFSDFQLPFIPVSLFNLPGIKSIRLRPEILTEEFITKSQPSPKGVYYILNNLHQDDYLPISALFARCNFIRSLELDFYDESFGDVLSQMDFVEHLRINIENYIETETDFENGSDLLDLNLLSSFTSLRSLELDNIRITPFPAFMKEFTKLTHLKFKEHLTSDFHNPFPNGLEYLVHLEELIINGGVDNYQLTELCSLKKLIRLEFGCISLIDEFNNLGSLKRLVLYGMVQHDPIILYNLNKVEYLRLSNCVITGLGISSMSNLIELHIIGCNTDGLISFPDLPSLESMDYVLYHDDFPNNTSRFSKVRRLKLKGTAINIDEGISGFKSLEYLDLERASITSIHNDIGKLDNLTEINLSESEINTLPDGFGNLKNLKKLDLWRSSIEKLPETFGNLNNLETLNIIHTNIRVLPDSFANLSNLRVFKYHSSKIKSVPRN